MHNKIGQKIEKILVIQTAFIGDVVLATSLIEKIRTCFQHSSIDFLLRKGNESLFANHPYLNQILIWDKKKKYPNLFKQIRFIRKQSYDLVINLQRFFSSGLITACSKAKYRIGFSQNPLSFLFTQQIQHYISQNAKQKSIHEIERNHACIEGFIQEKQNHKHVPQPRLYPSLADYQTVQSYQKQDYICMAPTSVFFTKQWPRNKWVELINSLAFTGSIYLIGGQRDYTACQEIQNQVNHTSTVINLAGKLSFLESAALMQKAVINYVNDSAPTHIGSAVNARVCTIFCSTLPSYGFSPLSTFSRIVQIDYPLACRPCGLHGKRQCPQTHFRCAQDIHIDKLLQIYQEAMSEPQ